MTRVQDRSARDFSLTNEKFQPTRNIMNTAKSHTKIRLICISKVLPAYEAVCFARHFKDLFEPIFVWADPESRFRQRGFRHQYYVVRIPRNNEPEISGHELHLDVRELLNLIPSSSKTGRYLSKEIKEKRH